MLYLLKVTQDSRSIDGDSPLNITLSSSTHGKGMENPEKKGKPYRVEKFGVLILIPIFTNLKLNV